MYWQARLLRRTLNEIHTQADLMEQQTQVLRDSVAAAQKAADAAETSANAAMGFAIPILRLDEFQFIAPGTQTLVESLKMPCIHISVRNYGQSPAFLKSFAVQFTCEELPAELRYPSLLHFDPITVLESGHACPLNEQGVFPWSPFSDEDATAIASGKKTLTIFGCIWYGDVFSTKTHKVLFRKWGAGFSDLGAGAMWLDPEITYEVDKQPK
jgi:hypothetical protein